MLVETACVLITESQDGWGWQGPLGASRPAWLQEGHPEERSLGDSGRYPRRGLHSFSRQPVPRLWHLHSTEVLLGVQTASLMFQFVPIASCPGTGYCWKELSSVLFALSLQVFVCVEEINLRLLFSRMNSSSSLSLCSYERCSSPLIIW